FALGTDSSPRFIEDARREAAEAGVENVAFETADAQTAEWDPIYDYAFSRMETQFFAAPVPAMRAIRGALKPGGSLAKVCWRRKAESPFWAETEQVDRKSTRLNSSHVKISYAVFCLKKKNTDTTPRASTNATTTGS